MKTYWAMKTFLEWENFFQSNSYIGIDQEGVDKNFLEYSTVEVDELVEEEVFSSASIARNFRQFCRYMQVGDHVVVGTGAQGKFNVTLFVEIIGVYEYIPSNRKDQLPAHVRKVRVIKRLDNPVPYPELLRVPRLEVLHPEDWDRIAVLAR